MEDQNLYYIELINRYFSGNLEEDDQQLLATWIQADPGHREVFEELRKTWHLLNRAEIAEADTTEAWKRISTKFTSGPRMVSLPVNRLFSSLKVAAIIILLLIPGYFVYKFLAGSTTKVLVAGHEVAETNLPDGSHISLKSGSELEYPSRFSKDERLVKLQGQACFDVALNSRSPFIIASGNIRIQVLGTSFHVNTHAEGDQLEVVLSRGKVKVYYQDDPGRPIILLPGEKATALRNVQKIEKQQNEDPNFMSWKTRRVKFNNTPLEEAIRTLSDVYGVNICLAVDTSSSRITAAFDHQSLASVLNVISQTLDLRVQQQEKTITLFGNKVKGN